MVGTATRQVGIVPISICCNKYYSNPPVKDQCINFMLFNKVAQMWGSWTVFSSAAGRSNDCSQRSL